MFHCSMNALHFKVAQAYGLHGYVRSRLNLPSEKKKTSD